VDQDQDQKDHLGQIFGTIIADDRCFSSFNIQMVEKKLCLASTFAMNFSSSLSRLHREETSGTCKILKAFGEFVLVSVRSKNSDIRSTLQANKNNS
jgi:hypothetical protein